MSQTPFRPVDATIVDPEHRFTSIIELPNDIRIEVNITIPERLAWQDVGDIAEVAQMAASTARGHVLRGRDAQGRAAF